MLNDASKKIINLYVNVGKNGLRLPQFSCGQLGKVSTSLLTRTIRNRVELSLMSDSEHLYKISLPTQSLKIVRKKAFMLGNTIHRYIPILKKGEYTIKINFTDKILNFYSNNNTQEIYYNINSYTGSYVSLKTNALKYLIVVKPIRSIFNNFFITITNSKFFTEDDVIKITKKSGEILLKSCIDHDENT